MKRKFNRKLLIFCSVIFSVALVSALSWYAIAHVTLNVNQPIDVLGAGLQEIDCDLEIGESTICSGSEITISNDGESEGTILISGSQLEDGISVKYWSELQLTKKIVDFTKDVWEIPVGADTVDVRYTLFGEGFQAYTDLIEGYVLIYYADGELRFANPQDAIFDVAGNLPFSTDANSDGYEDGYDYCVTGEYDTCHGAKIWYVPSEAISGGVIDWNMADEFYFETKLIQYNADGNIIIYPGSNISFTPEYTIDSYLPDGIYSQEITIA